MTRPGRDGNETAPAGVRRSSRPRRAHVPRRRASCRAETTTTSPGPRLDGIARDLLEASPLPTLVVDADLRVFAANAAARAELDGASTALPERRAGEVLGCVHASGPRGCGRESACAACAVAGAVRQALASGPVRRGHALVPLRRPGGVTEARLRVSAAPLGGAGAALAALALEDLEDARTGGDLSTLELADVLDAEALRGMMQELHALTGIAMAILDLRGNVLVGVGWQDVCTRFHRVHPETCRHCLESDTTLSAGVPPGEIRRYRCKNGMWDVATPIFLGGQHVGNVFIGQFFFDDEPVDRGAFRAQAARYGFEERAYLTALDAVPRLSRDAVAAAMQFFVRLAHLLSETSYANLKLARTAAEREAWAASLREGKERLEENDRRKDEFLAMLSHELRNPLAPIRNSLYLLDRVAPGSEQASRARGVIGRQVRHLTRLVDDLLDVTRISHGKISLSPARLDVREVVRRTCDDNRSAFEQGDVEMHLDLPFGPVWVDADETRVAQAVGNLVQNAAKFTPAGGRVVVRVGARDGRAEIGVRDTGVGIDPRELERMFQPFAQADQGLARTQGGLGLGLALVKGLVELHGGTVRASSDGVGKGAEFVIALPLSAGAAEDRGRGAPSAGGDGKLVLVVEDDADAAESLAEVLRLDGHRAVVAATGALAIELARELSPDAVLCDIGLPDLTGYDVARAIRQGGASRSPRLVALSGYAQPEDRQRALASGFDAHVAKPVDPRELDRVLTGAAPPVAE